MIGERLEEARKRKGISIREAAEATKIRGEYLMSMEDNSFDIDLPNIYIRGFLKNYARFLKLDPDKILTDFDAQQLGRTHATETAQRTGRESYGRMEIGGDDEDDDSQETEASQSENTFAYASQTRRETPPPPTLEPEGTRRDQEAWADNKTLYLKVGVVFGGLLVLAVILVVLIRLISGGPSPEINPELAQAPNTQTETSVQQPAESTQPPAGSNAPSQTTSLGTATPVQDQTIILRATDTVTVIVKQVTNGERIYSGTLLAGETISRERSGPVSIRFTNGSALAIEANGQTYRPNQSGVARTVIE